MDITKVKMNYIMEDSNHILEKFDEFNYDLKFYQVTLDMDAMTVDQKS